MLRTMLMAKTPETWQYQVWQATQNFSEKNNLFPMTEIVTTNNFFMTKPRAQI